ncbi:uncharacterized protein LDX57_008032 [Aspergillus melleus]|uniref:uncharacterized protein n=1 Tax=Aspergillus melleus TaxID=138277 RepID=UPI001E8E2926|nr:uncharacterized protein LDX57_008032 [Aspergillus melleus]KAH8430368.1 hypothetical protein LDX57_008032 [Aspergillus melleus]
MITEEGKVIVQHLEAIFDAVDRREIDHPAELPILGFRLQADLIIDCEVARHRVLGVVHPEAPPTMPGTLALLLTTKRAPLREGFLLGGSERLCTLHGAQGRHTRRVARETSLEAVRHSVDLERSRPPAKI